MFVRRFIHLPQVHHFSKRFRSSDSVSLGSSRRFRSLIPSMMAPRPVFTARSMKQRKGWALIHAIIAESCDRSCAIGKNSRPSSCNRCCIFRNIRWRWRDLESRRFCRQPCWLKLRSNMNRPAPFSGESRRIPFCRSNQLFHPRLDLSSESPGTPSGGRFHAAVPRQSQMRWRIISATSAERSTSTIAWKVWMICQSRAPFCSTYRPGNLSASPVNDCPKFIAVVLKISGTRQAFLKSTTR